MDGSKGGYKGFPYLLYQKLMSKNMTTFEILNFAESNAEASNEL